MYLRTASEIINNNSLGCYLDMEIKLRTYFNETPHILDIFPRVVSFTLRQLCRRGKVCNYQMDGKPVGVQRLPGRCSIEKNARSPAGKRVCDADVCHYFGYSTVHCLV